MFRFTPPLAPAQDRETALNTLWAFVLSLGFDPQRVIEAYGNHEAFALGTAVGGVHAGIRESISPEDAKVLGFHSKH